MSSILDQYVAIKAESTYGTAATGAFRGYESSVDGFNREVSFIEGGGRRAGRAGLNHKRRRIIDRGAKGRVECPVLTRGEGVRLQHLLGSASGPTAVTGQSGSYKSTYKANEDGPGTSYTINVARCDTGGTLRYFQYTGAIATGFSISVEENGELTLGIDYDCQDEAVVSTAPTAPTYADNAAEMFVFEDCGLSLAGSAVTNFKGFTLEGELAMDTERFFLDAAGTKAKPSRSGVPEYTGTLSGEFKDLTEYNRFIGGDVFSLVLTATHPDIVKAGATQKPVFKVTLPKCQYSGNTPESAVDSLTMVEMPFVALSDDSNEICNIEYICGDSAF